MPPTVPINHYLDPRNQQNKIVILFHYSMLQYSSKYACFEHSNFLTVKTPAPPCTQLRAQSSLREVRMDRTANYLTAGRTIQSQNPTTSFLTATTLIYAIGAGITAAAGTRLALQLILDKGFKLFSFQLQGL